MPKLEVYALLPQDKKTIRKNFPLDTALYANDSYKNIIIKFKLLVPRNAEGLELPISGMVTGFTPGRYAKWLLMFDFNIRRINTTEKLSTLLNELHTWRKTNEHLPLDDIVPGLEKTYSSVDALILFTSICVADHLWWSPQIIEIVENV